MVTKESLLRFIQNKSGQEVQLGSQLPCIKNHEEPKEKKRLGKQDIVEVGENKMMFWREGKIVRKDMSN